ncbi:hypothetical protein HYU23_01000 [Candidatus Woesearchaeota archaeon]|nr:hypothetical protein [Candidatus Woesearchaeota archaeon]
MANLNDLVAGNRGDIPFLDRASSEKLETVDLMTLPVDSILFVRANNLSATYHINISTKRK